jgi:hypothetical protein
MVFAHTGLTTTRGAQKGRCGGDRLIMLSVFLILRSLIYVVLRLEEYALPAGAVLGFTMSYVVLTVLVRVTLLDMEVAPHLRQQAG